MTDPQPIIADQMSFSLVPAVTAPTDTQFFEINSLDENGTFRNGVGFLRSRDFFNFENSKVTYQMSIKVTNSLGFSAQAFTIVIIQDVNEYPPTFTVR